MSGYLRCSKCRKSHPAGKFQFNEKTYKHGTVCSSCRHSPSLRAKAKRERAEELKDDLKQSGEVLNSAYQRIVKEIFGEDRRQPRERTADEQKEWERGLRARLYSFKLYSGIEVSPEQWKGMFKAQDGVCAICSRAEVKGKRLAMDHDHDTGEVRGLLCNQCNVGLGKFDDSIYHVRSALRYLETPPARKVFAELKWRKDAEENEGSVEHGYLKLLGAIFQIPEEQALAA